MLLLSLLFACNSTVVVTEHPPFSEGRGKVVPELVGTWAVMEGKDPVFSVDIHDGRMNLRIREDDAWQAESPLPLRTMHGALYTQLRVDTFKPTPDYQAPEGRVWSVLRLDVQDEGVILSTLNPDWFYSREGQRVGLDVRFPGDVVQVRVNDTVTYKGPDVILGSAGGHLRRWLRKHHDEDKLFTTMLALHRVSPTPVPDTP